MIDYALEALQTLAWPLTIVFLVAMFRAEFRERVSALRSVAAGSVRVELDTLRREVAATPEVAATRPDAWDPGGREEPDRLYALTRTRLEVDQELRRFARAAFRDEDFATRDLSQIIFDLREAGELSAAGSRQLHEFLRLSDARFTPSSESKSRVEPDDEELAALVTIGTLLRAYVRYRQRVASITTEFWGHDLMKPLHCLERDQEAKTKYAWAIIATLLPEVDYNYQIFTDAMRRASVDDSDRNWPKQMSREFLQLIVSPDEFFEIVKFRRDELRRMLREGDRRWWRTTTDEYEDAKREAEESGGDPGEYRTEWRYYHWPESWGKIGMNQPLLRREKIGPEEVAEDLLNAEAALRRMRLEHAS